MITPSMKDLQQVNQRLKKNSHDLHREVLLNVLDTVGFSDSFSDFRRIVGDFRYQHRDDVIVLLKAADSLAATAYGTAAEHFAANQLVALVKKYPFPVLGLRDEAEKSAWTKFLEAEQRCSVTNDAVRSRNRGEIHENEIPSERILHRMRAFIAYVLGDEPRMMDWISLCDFGPGANIGVSGNATNKKRKMLSRWSVSPAAYDYARTAVRSHLQLHELLIENGEAVREDCHQIFDERFFNRTDVIKYNKVVFVPKTTLVLRPIAVEPLLNGFLQKGIDLVMRDSLKKRANVDLSDQEENCQMAWVGSFDEDDSYCTIDLSSASDSIAQEIVKDLLPPDWFYLLDRIRSHHYRKDGADYRYQKFCSMGNGFCFPLQTLLFLAVCHANEAGKPGIDYRVYGDDIIVRKSSFESVVATLSQLGFVTNKDKTFGSGPFRESCGKDYYSGVDVRPVYLDYQLDSVQSVFKFHNSTLRSINCDTIFASVRSVLFERIPSRWRFVAPDLPDITDSAFRVGRSSAQFLSSPFTRYSLKTWSMCWIELASTSYTDHSDYGRCEREVGIAYLYGALSGSPSRKTFTIRRNTRAIISRKVGAGATSMWLPYRYGN
jgi:hypothetical protein